MSLVLSEFQVDMRIAKRATATIEKRTELLLRLARFLEPTDLVDATEEQLRGFQATFAHLSPASVDIYTRHMRAFYQWAYRRRWIRVDLAQTLIAPTVRRGLPHPTSPEDLRLVFSCVGGGLRAAYVLAAFAGLRRGEICRLHRRDIDTGSPDVVALIHGKGRRERKVPLIEPVMDELYAYGMGAGWVVRKNGKPYPPERLSVDSHNFLAGLGLATTLHSMRHYYATHVGRITKDPMLVRDLCGHQSVSTTEIYMDTDLSDAHRRLAEFASGADVVLNGSRRPRRRAAGS